MNFNIKANITIEDAQSRAVLAELQALKEAVMSQSEKIGVLTNRLDVATNEIAKDLKDLRDKIAAGTVSDEDLAPLDMRISQLEALGQDPADPVPDPPKPTE